MSTKIGEVGEYPVCSRTLRRHSGVRARSWLTCDNRRCIKVGRGQEAVADERRIRHERFFDGLSAPVRQGHDMSPAGGSAETEALGKAFADVSLKAKTARGEGR